jgi:hypothetical protein
MKTLLFNPHQCPSHGYLRRRAPPASDRMAGASHTIAA